MTEFEKQFQQVKELLSFEDYNKVIKRIIPAYESNNYYSSSYFKSRP